MRRQGLHVLGRRGSSALEFALIAPFLVVMMLGVFEGTELYRAQMKVQHAAGLLVKMVAQQVAPVSGGTSGSLGDFCVGARLSMTPLATTGFASVIASVTNTSGTAAEDWQSDNACVTAAASITPAAAVSLATTPGLVPDAGDSIVIVTATYTYKAPSSLVFSSSYTLTSTAFARPRSNATIACSTTNNQSC